MIFGLISCTIILNFVKKWIRICFEWTTREHDFRNWHTCTFIRVRVIGFIGFWGHTAFDLEESGMIPRQVWPRYTQSDGNLLYSNFSGDYLCLLS